MSWKCAAASQKLCKRTFLIQLTFPRSLYLFELVKFQLLRMILRDCNSLAEAAATEVCLNSVVNGDAIGLCNVNGSLHADFHDADMIWMRRSASRSSNVASSQPTCHLNGHYITSQVVLVDQLNDLIWCPDNRFIYFNIQMPRERQQHSDDDADDRWNG